MIPPRLGDLGTGDRRRATVARPMPHSARGRPNLDRPPEHRASAGQESRGARPTHGPGRRHGTEHPFEPRPVETRCTTPPRAVDKPRGRPWKTRAANVDKRPRAWMSTKRAKPPHLAVALRGTQPLHLVVLALTTASHRRIVQGSLAHRDTRNPAPPSADPPTRGLAQEPSATRTTRRTRQLPRRDGRRRSTRWPEPRPAASPSTTRSSPRQRPPADHAGPYGASFDGTDPNGKPAKGLTFERRWTRPGVHPYDEITWEYRTAGIANEIGQVRLRAEGRRGPELLVPARHQRRRVQVLPRPPRHPGARDVASASSSIASSTRSPPGPRPSATSPATRTSRRSRPS